MKAAGISGLLPRKRRRTTVRLPGVRVAPDLLERDFRPDGPNQTWSADITPGLVGAAPSDPGSHKPDYRALNQPLDGLACLRSSRQRTRPHDAVNVGIHPIRASPRCAIIARSEARFLALLRKVTTRSQEGPDTGGGQRGL
jgi:hypothetical protein